MASFDDAYCTLSSSTGQLNKITRSQERLLDVRKTELQPITKQPEAENFLGKSHQHSVEFYLVKQ